MATDHFRSPRLPVLGSVADCLPHDARRLVYRFLSPSIDRSAKALRREMAPYTQSRSIFVHLPKAAGVSVAQSLYGGFSCFHVTSSWYSLALSYQQIKQCYVFTITRNPWDRLHSAYHFLRGGGFNDVDRYFWNKYLSKYKDFRDFVIDLPHARYARASIVHLYPMHHFVEVSPGRNILNYFGYYEDLPQAFLQIAAHAGLGTGLPHLNKNISKDHSYLSSYNGKMIDVVGELYERDISLFGYTFDSFSRDKAKIRPGNCRQ